MATRWIDGHISVGGKRYGYVSRNAYTHHFEGGGKTKYPARTCLYEPEPEVESTIHTGLSILVTVCTLGLSGRRFMRTIKEHEFVCAIEGVNVEDPTISKDNMRDIVLRALENADKEIQL